MHWLQTIAPIRLKTKVMFGCLCALVALSGLLAAFLPMAVGLGATAALTAVGAIASARFRSAICDPYVATVVRMEALAAGDLDSPIEFTDYRDCVGRLTKAMFTFRQAALDQIRDGQEQQAVVRLLGEHLDILANGDLTRPIAVDIPPAYGALKTNFNAALESLRELIGAVAMSAESIQTGSAEIAHASEDLARRSESNASSLEETTAAISQMDQRLRMTAEAASRTVSQADHAITIVAGGRSITDEAVQAMGRVSDSAKGIDGVIEGLDKIAFQTRVLAMNAAVEAGRAGDAGRGFAVVADLVSALAMRAEEEAKAARDQLTVTQADIVTAVEAVQRVDGALADISQGVGAVHGLLGQMATDNQAQSSAIAQISVAVGTMDQTTQQNSAMVEQTSAAARNLAQESVSLADRAAQFRIGEQVVRKQQPAKTIRAKTPAPRAAYASPVKALPMAALSHGMAGDSGDWNAF